MIGIKGVPYAGGVEQFVEDVGCRLASRGHRVTVYVRRFYTPHASCFSKGIWLEHTPGIHSKNLDAITHSTTALLRALNHGFDVIYLHSLGQAPLALIPRLLGVPTALHLHGRDWQRAKWGAVAKFYLKAAEYPAVWFPNAVASVARVDADYYTAEYGKQVRHIANGVSVQPVPGNDRLSQFRVQPSRYGLFLGRLVPEKGCHYLLEAYRNVRSDMPLIVAGDNDHADEYTQALKAQGSDRIRFVGFVRGADREQLLAHCALFVQPSDLEGLPHTILHALSYGRRVLASDIGNNVEALGGHGFLFRKSDVSDLEEKLRELFDVPDGSVDATDARIQYVQRLFNWELITNQVEDMLFQVAGR